MKQLLPFLFSLLIVGLGQPVWGNAVALLSALCGYALFFGWILRVPSNSGRFWWGTLWYWGVGMLQYMWVISHPYAYAYLLWSIVPLLFAFPWGAWCIVMPKFVFEGFLARAALAGVWVLCEWSRLFLLSGIPFNPAGLSLSASLVAMQSAAIWGIYGLSFVVLLGNLSLVAAWTKKTVRLWLETGAVFFVPLVYGWWHLEHHAPQIDASPKFPVLAIQTGFSLESELQHRDFEEHRRAALERWGKIFALVRSDASSAQLIVLPEYVIPYGTVHPVFFREEIDLLARRELASPLPLPDQQPHLSNGDVARALADHYQLPLIMGLEDHRESVAFLVRPHQPTLERYAKRVLVPLGEYIPFQWCRGLAAYYGVTGSLEPGKEAVCFAHPVPIAPSICYEELYGSLVREGRLKGAELLVNLTNDGWYPDSLLPQQHFDHAKLRAVENGVPMVRACNTGITAGLDSCGRIVASLGGSERSGSLLVSIPLHHYQTPYSRWGDAPLLTLCCLGVVLLLKQRKLCS